MSILKNVSVLSPLTFVTLFLADLTVLTCILNKYTYKGYFER